MSYAIIEWGPGFRQEYTNGGRCAPIMTGNIAVTVSDPTKVLFWQGAQRLVIRVLPWDQGTQKFVVTGGSHGGPPGLYDRQGDRFAAYLVEHFEGEIRRHFDALPLVMDCRPPLNKIDKWVYEGLTLWTFDPYEKVTPETHPFGPTLYQSTPEDRK